jgi:uncharacterized protein (DUF849 family)
MNQRKAFKDTVLMGIIRNMPKDGDLGLHHMIDMDRRLDEHPEYSDAKIGRWLGWAQAALVAANVGVTLEDVKQVNMRWANEE